MQGSIGMCVRAQSLCRFMYGGEGPRLSAPYGTSRTDLTFRPVSHLPPAAPHARALTRKATILGTMMAFFSGV